MLSDLLGHNGKHLFTPNNGQWHDQVKYKVLLPDGSMYFENKGITFDFIDKSYLKSHGKQAVNPPDFVKGCVLRLSFENAQHPRLEATDKSDFYYNYFLGNNPSRWASKVPSYSRISYKELYQGINLDYYYKEGFMKYDFIVKPGAKPETIKIRYEGAETLLIKGNHFVARTGVVDLIEQEPYAYQWVEGEQKQVRCWFKLTENTLSFEVGSYDTTLPLVIDPILIFSSFTGSTADNFGFTATYDDSKHAYVGGIVFGTGQYPTTTGAYQANYMGGGTDIGVSKFSPDGSTLIYSTYIGSINGREAPHSIVVNDQDELYILGTTGGNDFPTTVGAFQPAFNGGALLAPPQSGMAYPSGSDLVVCRLSADGTQLLASTYVGGSANDGLNNAIDLIYNYGDAFRGEIIVDNAGNCIVASCTASSDFPTTPGSFNPTYSGGQEGVVFKMPPALNTMLWSGYYGGTGDDAAYGMQPDAAGNLYVCGGTKSPEGTLPQPIIGTFGGVVDGFVAKISAAGNSILTSRLISTPQYDQAYFVQLDQNENVYLYGQSKGDMPVSHGVYNTPSSGQFIQKYSNDLSALLWSTTIGRGTGEIDISPTAFLVDICDFIYISGWGGTTNRISPYQATSSSTTGMPITQGAFQPTTNGSDFYIMVLAPDAQALIYSTFFGGATSREHVDGGTSRFDKNGIIYQAVCAGCGANSDFPTTPGAWSNTNNSFNCNLGVFKFGLDQIVADFTLDVVPNNCTYPMQVNFTNNSQAATIYFWDFGDGSPIVTETQPSHYYTQPGTYTIKLIAADIYGCYGSDTLTIEVTLPTPPQIQINEVQGVCTGFNTPIYVTATNGSTYSWSPAELLNDPSSPNPSTEPLTQDTWFYVTITDTNSCTLTDSVFVRVYPQIEIDAGPDIFTDFFGTYKAGATFPPNATILWTPSDGLSCTQCPSPYVFPDNTTTYLLTATDEYGCIYQDSIVVYVSTTIYVPNAFTPDGDGVNDYFKVLGKNISEFELFIYNRWGDMIFYSDDMEKSWDGQVNETPAKQDVYVWVVNYKTFNQLENNILRGHVTLLR